MFVAITIIILLVIFTYLAIELSNKSTTAPIVSQPAQKKLTSYDAWRILFMHPNSEAAEAPAVDVQAVVDSLPKDSASCSDRYDVCAKLAGECNTNPEYMYYNCPSTCQVCSLSDADKAKAIETINSTSPLTCANGIDNKKYPNQDAYMPRYEITADELLSYQNP